MIDIKTLVHVLEALGNLGASSHGFAAGFGAPALCRIAMTSSSDTWEKSRKKLPMA